MNWSWSVWLVMHLSQWLRENNGRDRRSPIKARVLVFCFPKDGSSFSKYEARPRSTLKDHMFIERRQQVGHQEEGGGGLSWFDVQCRNGCSSVSQRLHMRRRHQSSYSIKRASR